MKAITYSEFKDKMMRFKSNIAFTYYDDNNDYNISYADFLDDIERFAESLEKEGIRNSRVVFCTSNTYELIPLSIALVKLNNVVLFVDCNAIDFLRLVVEKYNVSYVVASEDIQKEIDILGNSYIENICINRIRDEVYRDDADEVADYILFTSGSTSTPKGVLISAENMLLAAEYMSNGFKAYKNTLLVLPMNHIYGYNAIIMSHLYRGENIILSNGIKFLNKELKRFNPYTVFMVPTLLYSYYDLNLRFGKSVKEVFGSNISALYVGGGKLDSQYIFNYRKYGIEVMNGYGITEMCGCISIMHEGTEKMGCVGEPYPGVDIKSVDGELYIKSPYKMSGYYDGTQIYNPIEDGWYRTGDEGYVEEGTVYIIGRKDNLVVLPNGKNIYGPEFCGMIKELEGVEEAMVSVDKNGIVVKVQCKQYENEFDVVKRIEALNATLPMYMKINRIEVIK